ncbi:response regulator [Spirochaeta isovalerica]|uniref:DNA-binding response OmpR family regulator n=1 Tax=Spirochaeta isovalerica TaxID=150 RepID=A0A841RCL9_9SPIO|nr:response regulator [Spirochaeta isovalerica]MBB6481141.1 DNA-binding response OmpR family regulator [Spirochaeta isovalerica]
MGKSLLIVEDEDAIRLTLREFLTRKGYDVHVASDGVGAIRQLLDNNIDMIVSDYRMPSLGGDYWIRFLQHFCAEIPVLITSGFLSPEIPIPFTVIYKPFDYGELEERIASEIGRD